MNIQYTNMESLLYHAAMFRKAYVKACYSTLKEKGFSPNEIEVLVFLSNNKHIDTSKELALYLQQSKGLICRSVERLQQRGLIHIIEDDKDRRIHHLRLEDDSEGIVQTIKSNQSAFASVITDNISEHEWLQLLSVMKKIENNVKCFMEGNDVK